MVKLSSTCISSLCFIPGTNHLSSTLYQRSLAAPSQTSEYNNHIPFICIPCSVNTALRSLAQRTSRKKKIQSQTVSQIVSREHDTFLNQPSLLGFNWVQLTHGFRTMKLHLSTWDLHSYFRVGKLLLDTYTWELWVCHLLEMCLSCRHHLSCV